MWNSGGTRDFYGLETIKCNTCHNALSKPLKCNTTNLSTNVWILEDNDVPMEYYQL